MTDPPSPSLSQRPGRLHSLDALRGLDMLCIIGLDGLMHTLPGVFPDSEFCSFLAKQFGHVAWEGCRLYDLIFPIFVFISGMAMAYSMSRRLEGGRSRLALSWDVIKRGLILVAIGLVMNGIMDLRFGEIRYPSVLGLIGIATTIGGLAVIWLRSVKRLAVFCAGMLAAVGCLQLFGGDFTPAGCVNGLIDRAVVPGVLFKGNYDPEGLLCCISASFLAVAGYLTGRYMRRLDHAPFQAAAVLAGSGIVLVAAASGLAYVIPVIKAMWTPSFNMLACGWGLIVFALAYLVVDLGKCRRIGWFFEVIGYNALAIYVGQAFINFWQINVRLFGGLAGLAPDMKPLILAATLILLKWWLLAAMRKADFRVRIG